MKIIKIYKADDGYTFKKEKECLVYDNMLKNNKFSIFKIGYHSKGSSCFPEDEWEYFIVVKDIESAFEAMKEIFDKAKNDNNYKDYESDIKDVNDFLLKTLRGKTITWSNIIDGDLIIKKFEKYINGMKNYHKQKEKRQEKREEKEKYNQYLKLKKEYEK